MKNKKLLALALSLLLLLSALTACAASSDKSAMPMEASQAMTMEAPAAYAEEKSAAYDMDVPLAEPAMDGGEGGMVNTQSYEPTDVADPAAQAAEFTKKIIYSANVSLQTTEFDKTVSALEQAVASFGGFVENANSNGNVRYDDDGSSRIVDRWAWYTVRVPAQRFEEFLSMTNGLGNVTESSRNAENVTSSYTDYEARLSSLNTQEERLLDMLKKAEDVDSLIALEQRLADVRYEIESIQRNLRNLDMDIGYSTVDVNIQEVEVYTRTVPVQRSFGEKVADALREGWASFTRDLQYFVIDLLYALPGLILFAVIVTVIVLVVVKTRKKVKARKAAKKAAKEAAKPEDRPEQ